ncbi:MAG: hypothetical protein QM780_00685 [Hyphomicrobium sp.]|uniref:hypothetical protein n=1 Tax=Hyphomicrobium sp. TaxID=82 RepID=UPI0039E3E135
MIEPFAAFLIRVSALITIFVVLTASLWAAMKKLGYLRLDQPFSATDVRTWSLSFAILDATFYGTVFALFKEALGENPISIAIAAAAASLVALRALPALVARKRP